MTIKLAKSEQTLQAIIKTALQIAVVEGLQAVTLGEVAKRMDISKSGVFARVGSVEALQSMVIKEYSRIFVANVFTPALSAPRGLPRLNAIMRLWIGRGTGENAFAGGLHATAAFDLDHVESQLRDELLEAVLAWRVLLKGAIVRCIEEGHLRPETDPAQLTFEINSLMVGFLHESRFVRDPAAHERATSAYQRLISTYRSFSYAD
ncbi:TetR/AcrR family transcriptional regulator [Piscinibacter sp. HJYY11]|uniref:TetR/AcrR family transcriptional regulator n=1 Tax=Piscinibacter sp. HJYY11 TaxID=2801333 RepID=UPI00191E7AFA|nr:TetR/AcrR family transcriptional regulator [Piscinibacter sp. HJYY11]MBL0729037.1 TetR/AcrR family transcriptional regulator [Piscinibacter sp. HJYY11]